MEEIKRDDWNDFLTVNGGAVKALEGGRVAGYLVTFSDENSPDVAGDFFTKETDFGEHKTTVMLYHHGLDDKLGLRKLGEGTLKADDVGIWVEAQLELRDKYEKAIYKLAQKGKLGWSSGTAPHLVRREKVGDANKITSWMLGLDASLTPTPAEPRNSAMTLKTIKTTDIETIIEPEADDTAAQTTINNSTKGSKVMTEEEKAAQKAEAEAAAKEVKSGAEKILDSLKAEIDRENEIKSAEEKKAKELEVKMREVVQAAMKNAPAEEKSLKANLNLKAPKGDSAEKALNHWIKTGDNGGLRADPAYKTDYSLVEGTQYQGQELVPTEVVNKIFELRDKGSIARAAGANVLQVSSASVNVPFEKARQDIMVAVGEATAYDPLSAQIFDKKAITIVKETRKIPISEELLEDSVVDLVPYFQRKAGVLAAQIENSLFVSGATGAWYGSTKGLDFDSATAIGVTEPTELLMSLNSEYRDNIVWVCTKATEAAIRVLNTAYSFPFIGNGGASGFQGNAGQNGSGWGGGYLFGGRVFNDENVDAIGGGYKSLMVGNFQAGYTICERRAVTIRRDESTLSSGLINLLISLRVGGGIVVSEAFAHGLHPTA